MSPKKRVLLLGIAAIFIGGIIYYLEAEKINPRGDFTSTNVNFSNRGEKEKIYEPAKEISSPDGFVNVPGITVGEFVGDKVVLVDFWTYSCINCRRTIPYLNAWHEKYADKGLVIIGVHTPEFEFEKEYGNVSRAVEEFGIKYPVVLDNDFSTWRAYRNQYWPRKYLVDIDGFIVYDHIGEGAYEETEQKIQELLAERMERLGMEEEIASDTLRLEGVASVERGRRITPEIYFGSLRSGQDANSFVSLEGEWKVSKEYAENLKAGAKIMLKYDAKNVYFVASAERQVEAKIFIDGEFLKTIFVQKDGLYKLVEGDGYGEHALLIEILSPGLKAFTFTFG